MKHILIPTDFSVRSLNAVHAAMATCDETPLKITLFHLLRMPDQIAELFSISARNKHLDLITEEFKEGCEILQSRYGSSLHKLSVKFGFGNTVVYLKNLLAGERVTEILVCPDIQLMQTSPKSIEMLPLLKRTGYILHIVPSKTRKVAHKKPGTLTDKGIEILKTEPEEYYAAKK